MFTIYTDLPFDEAIEVLLNTSTDEPNQIILVKQKSDSEISSYPFELHRIIKYRNSFKPIFYGTIKPQNSGAVIEGHFRMHLLTRFVIWMSIIFNILGFLEPVIKGISSLLGGYGIQILQSALINALVFPVFGAILILSGRFILGSGDENFIRTFLIKTFN